MKQSKFRVVAGLFAQVLLCCGLSACGGSSSGSDIDARADAGVTDEQSVVGGDANQSLLADAPLACDAPFDSAELLLTEVDRQWSCEVSSNNSSTATSYTDLYFSRDGTVVFSGNDIRYWNRKLPGDDIGLASPASPSSLIQNINSSNTLMTFTMTTEAGVMQSYDCLLVTREAGS